MNKLIMSALISSSRTALSRLCKLCRLHGHPYSIRECTVSSMRWLHSGRVLLAPQTDGEKKITSLLTTKLKPSFVEVRDISGGCGSMYEICIESELFKGKRILQQHQMVNQALGDEVKSLHGLTIKIGNPNDST